MPNDPNSSHSRRSHYHRGRRGSDRRGPDRRLGPPAQEQSRDHVDVEQIMREIRARIAKRHGIDLAPQQIQELAARRLEAILEPRHMKPALMEQMRRAAGEPVETPGPALDPPAAGFDEETLYQSHRGLVRLLRRWLNPILKLLFNPAPIVGALNAQAKRNTEAAAREAELHARQAEWNALHYEILQRLVTESSRATIEMQTLAMRVESLAAKVDFNERRVRALENTGQQVRSASRSGEFETTTREVPATPPSDATAPGPTPAEGSSDIARRRRRRRRGRRGGGPQEGVTFGLPGAASAGAAAQADAAEHETESEGVDGEAGLEAMEDFSPTETGGEHTAPLEPAHAFSLLQPVERHPSPDVPPDVPGPERETARHEPAVNQPSPTGHDQPVEQAPHDRPEPDQER